MTIRAFRWTRENVRHIHRHGVKPREVEEAFTRRLELRRQGFGRYGLIGRTAEGRLLLVIFQFSDHTTADVITARELSWREKQRLRRRLKGK